MFVGVESTDGFEISNPLVNECISWICESCSDAPDKMAEEFNTVDMTIVCPSVDVCADISAWLLLIEKICGLSSRFMVVIPCVDVMSSVNAVDEVGVLHSVCNVVSGAVRSAKLEYIRVEMSVIEVTIVDVLYGAMEEVYSEAVSKELSVWDHKLDVSYRLGQRMVRRYKLKAASNGVSRSGNPGREYTGAVARTGEDVTSVKFGDAVIGMGDGCLKQFVVSKDKLVHRKPESFFYGKSSQLLQFGEYSVQLLVITSGNQ